MARASKSGQARPPSRERDPDTGRAALGYTRPRTYEELRAVLSSGTVNFPKRLRQVAIFLWQHPGEVALGTISEVAAQAGVQPSTLVRFAQTFGFAGFTEFQALFKQHIKGTWPDVQGRARNGRPPAAGETADHRFLEGLLAASRRSLARIGEGFDMASFEKMTALMAAADLIYVVGSKRAFPVTAYVSLTLSQQGVRNVLVDNVGSTAFDQVGCVGPNDAVLAVSFSPYNSITPELVAAARERHAKVVSITDSALSPLVGLSDAVVEVIESDFAGFRSLAATLAVGMALVHAVVARRSK
ncbi:MAG TPA: MurR/RpiR family transcriptional regulator [Bauldia sp.]|nr:MurR/RpiR family transcriptional regulator [Bauldia sp.]